MGLGGSREWTPDGRAVRLVRNDPGSPVDVTRWPATVPAVEQLLCDGLELPAGLTVLVGENGSGKSTVMEMLAEACRLNPQGGSAQARLFRTRDSEPGLGTHLIVERGPVRPRWSYFLRADTMHTLYTYLEDNPVTNTIGAMHGCGKVTCALIVESPALSAAKSAVLMLVMVAVFPAPMLWQLTRARKSGKGLVPCNAGGTGAWLARTSPRTRTIRWPSRLREPLPAVRIQGWLAPWLVSGRACRHGRAATPAPTRPPTGQRNRPEPPGVQKARREAPA